MELLSPGYVGGVTCAIPPPEPVSGRHASGLLQTRSSARNDLKFWRNIFRARTRGSIRLWLLVALIVLLALGIAWLSAGRSLTTFTDQLVTIRMPTPSVDKVSFDGDFRIGDLSLTSGTLNNYPVDFKLSTNASNLVVLTAAGRSFILGPRTNPVDKSGRPDIHFIPEQGDKVTLTGAHSLVGWPTPFEYTIMISNPSWKRYVYYRLVWHKRNGADLVMRWRYEQDYFSDRGWIRPAMMWDFHTGLISLASEP